MYMCSKNFADTKEVKNMFLFFNCWQSKQADTQTNLKPENNFKATYKIRYEYSTNY